MDASSKPDGTSEPTPVKADLPTVESPPLSPGSEPQPVIVVEPLKAKAPTSEVPAVEAPRAEEAHAAATPFKLGIAMPRFNLRPRHKRYAILAGSVVFAAALGAAIGALATNHPAPAVKPDVAALEQTKAMQQSIARLNKDIAALKGSLDQANKTAHTQIAKISERLARQTADITGSISPPQTAPPTAVPTPLPAPRPAQRIAAAEAAPAAHMPVIAGWSIHDVRDGYVFVRGHGEIFQVVPGAPLPGLGPVQSVKRQDGRWVVATPKGIIVSQRDRRYFDDF